MRTTHRVSLFLRPKLRTIIMVHNRESTDLSGGVSRY